MKQKNYILALLFFTLILAGCQEKSTTKKSSSSNTVVTGCDGTNYYTVAGCAGFCAMTANASNVACTSTTACQGSGYYTTPGCAGYCASYPTVAACTGSTTGSTSGGGATCTTGSVTTACSNYCTVYPGALGCLPNGTNCWLNTTAAGCPGSTTALNPQWGVNYPGGEPVGSCSTAYTSGTNSLATRKATVISSTFYSYNPIESSTANFLNTTDMLKTVATAKTFFMTDSILKLRVKVKASQDLTGTSSPDFCYGRVRPGVRVPGYTQLRYTVKVYGVSASNTSTYLGTVGTYTTGVNSCSAAIDLSGWQELSPTGVFVVIDGVQANQNCSYSTYNGYTNCSSFKAIRSFDCWGLDLEVAADGTQTFN